MDLDFDRAMPEMIEHCRSGITAALQSSTATRLMASGFIAGGLMALAPALAVMLGANVGSTVIVQILTFNIGVVAPIFILAGVIAFKRGGTTRIRDLGRVSIGLGLTILARGRALAIRSPRPEAKWANPAARIRR